MLELKLEIRTIRTKSGIFYKLSHIPTHEKVYRNSDIIVL